MTGRLLNDEPGALHESNDDARRARALELLGASDAMRRLRELIARLAPTRVTVLITGESGTGKELVARAIHALGENASGPFVAINCGAMPAELLESEMFGHERGAFTDARTARRGLFAEAQGGTLFLDEIGEMPIPMQVKLLRALQERTVRPVGGRTEIPFDARVVAATNRALDHEVNEGRFRADLYYRIEVCTIDVPALRDHPEDIALLANEFVARFAERHGKPVRGIAKSAMARLVGYEWPGNVRELENGIERAVAMARTNEITVEDLPPRLRTATEASVDALVPADTRELVTASELERRYTKLVLELVKGNKSKAAKILGFDRRTLYRKLERLSDYDESHELESGVFPIASLPIGHRDTGVVPKAAASSGRGSERPRKP